MTDSPIRRRTPKELIEHLVQLNATLTMRVDQLEKRLDALDDWGNIEDAWLDNETTPGIGVPAPSHAPATEVVAAENPRRIQVDDEGNVLAPAPTPRQRAAREGIASAALTNLQDDDGLTLPYEDAHKAFLKGGPAWLYWYAREHTTKLPLGVRRSLVEDVLEDDPEYAQLLGRDLLMEREPGADYQSAMFKAEQDRAALEAAT